MNHHLNVFLFWHLLRPKTTASSLIYSFLSYPPYPNPISPIFQIHPESNNTVPPPSPHCLSVTWTAGIFIEFPASTLVPHNQSSGRQIEPLEIRTWTGHFSVQNIQWLLIFLGLKLKLESPLPNTPMTSFSFTWISAEMKPYHHPTQGNLSSLPLLSFGFSSRVSLCNPGGPGSLSVD